MLTFFFKIVLLIFSDIIKNKETTCGINIKIWNNIKNMLYYICNKNNVVIN